MGENKYTTFYKLSADEVLKNFKVSEKTGLSAAEVAKRQQDYGPNTIESTKKLSVIKLFFSQFKDVLVIVLIFAATLSLGLSYLEEHGSPKESLLIYGIVVAIAIVGFLNEYKAEKTVEALKKLVGFNAKVIRDGTREQIAASELVPGDIILLAEGDKVPADVRILSGKALKVNESSLTGESLPVDKSTDVITETASLGDQRNMIFSGTIVNTGTARGVVVATGNNTEIGKIAHLVDSVEEEQTPMQKKLDYLGRQLGAGVLAVCLLVFVVIFFLDRELINESLLQRLILAFTASVALAVAAIPEGLAFVVRISLALGARRMAAKNALVRKLSAVEALGSTDVICSDKTGTLTKGEMTVRRVWTVNHEAELSGTGYQTKGDFSSNTDQFKELLKIGAFCNDAKLKGDGVIIGDPTEAALLVSAAKAGIKPDNSSRIDEVPFSSERKMMSTIHTDGSGYYVATKGAAEHVLSHCTHVLKSGKVVKLTNADKKEILKNNKEMAKEALRVLGFAYKTSSKKLSEKHYEEELIFVGLQGMMDPPRTEVSEVITRVQSEAGMRVIMITGDYIETAKAVAHEIGIEGEAISGVEIDELSEAEFIKKVKTVSIYARVNPEHKIRIVQALKKHGHQVAMTGDGVNDSPAIKAADIGIAMGVTGTDATKEAADLILLDDRFLTIVDAIEEGRGIFDNVRKFVNNLLSTNIAEVITILIGVLLFQNLLLTATQLLFINIVTDGLPSIALGSDPAEKGIMRFKPWHFQGNILNKRIWAEIIIFCTIMSIALVGLYAYVRDGDPIQAASIVFVGMVIFEMVRLIDIRTDYNIPWFSNPWLTVAMATSIGLQVLLLYVPPLANIFGVEPISLNAWLAIGVISAGLFGFMKIMNPLLDRWSPETHS